MSAWSARLGECRLQRTWLTSVLVHRDRLILKLFAAAPILAFSPLAEEPPLIPGLQSKCYVPLCVDLQ